MELFLLPFMQKALIAGVLLGIILPYLGVFTVLRRMAFFGDGIAHASLAGVAIGIATGFSPFTGALIIGVLFGIGIYVLERKTNLSSDAIIGTIFTTGLALGVIILSLQQGYQPELISFLFGSILTIGASDLIAIVSLVIVILIFLTFFNRHLALTVFDEETAWLSGIRTDLLEFIFYIALSLTVVLGVKLLGIILVSALLIIPSSTAKFISHSFKELVGLSIVFGEIAIIIGLILSYIFDLPSGAVIIVTAAALFLIVILFHSIKNQFVKKRIVG